MTGQEFHTCMMSNQLEGDCKELEELDPLHWQQKVLSFMLDFTHHLVFISTPNTQMYRPDQIGSLKLMVLMLHHGVIVPRP